jgi:carbonic anhydrase
MLDTVDAVDAFAADAPKTQLTPDAALRRLAAGNRRFVRAKLKHPRRDGVRRAAIAEGQAPFATVLGCADSRVPPEVVYDEGLGDLFIVRIAGNTATDPYVVGSVEYGVANLESVVLVVLGHQNCGAVKAAIDVAMNGTTLPGDIGAFVAPIVPIAKELIPTTSKDQLLEAVTRANIRQTVTTLSQAQLLADLIAQQKLKIVGREYQLTRGNALSIE